jgi:hypothetical protein
MLQVFLDCQLLTYSRYVTLIDQHESQDKKSYRLTLEGVFITCVCIKDIVDNTDTIEDLYKKKKKYLTMVMMLTSFPVVPRNISFQLLNRGVYDIINE